MLDKLKTLRKYQRIVAVTLMTLILSLYTHSVFAADYYVNDSSSSLDEWCTGVGNDANDGLLLLPLKLRFRRF